jgi:serine/threonine-protein kinase
MGPLQPGDRVGARFELARLAGEGAVGQVWHALDLHLDRASVALKVLHSSMAHDSSAVNGLKREVLLTRRLRHPHIVGVYTFWETEPHRFITMEYVAGPNLAVALHARRAPYPLSTVAAWARQLANALDYAHESGVLHRDVKPGNVLLGDDGLVRLADFGIARTARELRRRIHGQTTTGTVLYMSPEQLAGDALDPRSDVYSLAATLYALLAGRPPFEGATVLEQIRVTPPEAIAGLPAEANEALAAALSKRPGGRPGRCMTLAEALSSAASAAPGQASSSPARRADPDAETVRLRAYPGLDGDRLGALLVEAGAITPAQRDQALAVQEEDGRPLGEVLVRMGAARADDIADALATQLRLPRACPGDLTQEAELWRRVPEHLAAAHGVLPLRVEGDVLTVATADPLDLAALNAIEEATGLRVEYHVTTRAAIDAALHAAS